MTSYPTSIVSFSTKTDGVDYPQAAHINSLQDEVTAIETAIKANFGGTPTTGDLLYYDGTKWTALTPTYITASSTTTLTNKRITPRITTITSSATPTINTDDCDCVTITALAAAITSMTTNLSGTPTNFQKLLIRIKDDGTARAITWGTSFQSGSATLPTTTVLSKTLMVGLIYDSVDSKWTCEATGSRT